jgi:CubicO group peptidase (beta-lactamase class C family)
MLLLAELVRRTDGRDFAAYVREDVLEPLGMHDCWVGIPPDRYAALGDRNGVMHLTASEEPVPFPFFNSAEQAALPVPGGGGRGPMGQLANLYRALRARDGGILPVPVVEAMTARHRVGLFDETYGIHVDWGLGLMIDAISYGRHCSPRTFGHGGMQSSVAYCDPDADLVVAMLFNGMPGNERHYRRLERVSTTIYEDLGLVTADAPGRDHECPVEEIG